jgi:hypothetical protein
MDTFLNSNYKIDDANLRMIGEALILASIQFSIGSVEMSSKFSVKNFSKDQATLDSAVYALYEYIKISIIWSLCVIVLMYLNFGKKGALYAFITNFIFVYWIYYSYVECFKIAIEQNNLVYPKINIFGKKLHK